MKRATVVLAITQVAVVGLLFYASVATLMSAYASDLREFVLCEHATGKQRGPMLHEGVKTTGVFKTRPEAVSRLIEIDGDKCTMMIISSGAHVSVVGGAAEVECRLLGGNNCADRKAEMK